MDTSLELLQTISFSQKAELQLINFLLTNMIDEYDFSTRRALSVYPRLNPDEKTKTILNLSSELIKDGPSWNSSLESFENFERFLRAAGKRDHFVHQFEVFLLGWSILSHYFSFNNDVSDIKDKFNWWFITSMSHDIGYPVSSFEQIIKRLAELYDNENTQLLGEILKETKDKFCKLKEEHDNLINTADEVLVIIKQALDKLDIKGEEQNKLISKLTKALDHGYFSALLLFDSMVKAEKNNSFNDELYSLWTAGAISLHNLCHVNYSEIVRKINIVTNPFAYVLFIADCLQEWERPNNIDNDFPIFIMDNFYITPENDIIIKFILKHEHWTPQLVESQIEYIQKKEDRLNALDTTNVPFKIIIEYACTDSELNDKRISVPCEK
ncbi:MAG: hypothetical protein ACI8ZB_003155 [Desulforhopalus sp.]|jgi:hypothetical protein